MRQNAQKIKVMADIIDWMFKELWNTPKDKWEWNAILKKARDMQKEHNRFADKQKTGQDN